jgi:hypothetical protein
MTAERDVTRFVREWLEDGLNVIPDRVLDSVLDQLPATPQRRHWWQAWRNPFVMNNMKLALAAGVVVLATFVGLGLYFNQGGLIGPSPTPAPALSPAPAESPTPIVEQTPAPSPTPLAMFVPDGRVVPAGTYITGMPFPLQIEFTVPAGWQSWSVERDGIGVMKNSPPAGFGFWIVREVYPDPCNRLTNGPIDPGPTVDDLAGALQGLEGYQATAPTDDSLGGYSGKYLEITAPTDLRLGDCEAADPRLWRTEAGGNRSVYAAGEHDRIWILDVEGTRLLIKAAHQVGTPEADVAALEQMVDSVSIRAPERGGEAAAPLAVSSISHGTEAPAGTYVASPTFPLQIEFTIPAGWQILHDADAMGVMKDDGEPPAGSSLGFWLVDEVYLDPCDARLRGSTYVGPSVEHLADALAGLVGYEATTPSDVALGGYGGKYLEVTAPDDLSGCAFVRLWTTHGAGLRSVLGPAEHDRVWILDVDGTRLLVTMTYRPDTPDTDVAELERVIESIRISLAKPESLVVGEGVLDGEAWTASARRNVWSTTLDSGQQLCWRATFTNGTTIADEECRVLPNWRLESQVAQSRWRTPPGSPVVVEILAMEHVARVRVESEAGVFEPALVSLAPIGLSLQAAAVVLPPGTSTAGTVVLFDADGAELERHSL